jgi:hypothetical protein
MPDAPKKHPDRDPSSECRRRGPGIYAPVAKLVDAPGSDPGAERHRSSTLLWGTNFIRLPMATPWTTMAR